MASVIKTVSDEKRVGEKVRKFLRSSMRSKQHEELEEDDKEKNAALSVALEFSARLNAPTCEPEQLASPVLIKSTKSLFAKAKECFSVSLLFLLLSRSLAILKRSRLEASQQRTKTKPKKPEEPLSETNVDCGYAWVILAVMFVINASTFGAARAYTLIFEKVALEGQTRAQAALPFTIMGAVENMAGPLAGYLLTQTRSWRLTVLLGCCLTTLAHLFAAFLTHSQLGQTLTMGLMCGFGLSLVTVSSFQLNNAYFVRYRSRAFGFCLTGAAFGALYISPMCQYALKHHSIKTCYLVLSLLLLPNIPLSLLLKPKSQVACVYLSGDEQHNSYQQRLAISSISAKLTAADEQKKLSTQNSLAANIKIVVKNPMFHLIWPTQLIFCWLNFVFGMIIVDFGKDRKLNETQVAYLIPVWAFGQLAGRLMLGSLVDSKIVSYESFTVACFSLIGLATWSLNNFNTTTNDAQGNEQVILISLLVFILSMFISNLYLLFNGLMFEHTADKFLTGLSIGISSFIGSFFLLPRANIIGHYRDTFGNYDAMLAMFAYSSFAAAFVWLIAPYFCSKLSKICRSTIHKNAFIVSL